MIVRYYGGWVTMDTGRHSVVVIPNVPHNVRHVAVGCGQVVGQ